MDYERITEGSSLETGQTYLRALVWYRGCSGNDRIMVGLQKPRSGDVLERVSWFFPSRRQGSSLWKQFFGYGRP